MLRVDGVGGNFARAAADINRIRLHKLLSSQLNHKDPQKISSIMAPLSAPSPPTISSLYPSNWPLTPFHEGELQLQERFGVRELVNSYAPKVIRPFMPDQHREFYESLPFLVVAARDTQGRMWSTLLTSTASDFVTSDDPSSLTIQGGTVPGDALEHSLTSGIDLGVLGIEFATKRRNRVNGRIVDSSHDVLQFQVDQSFGNCSQYIRPRKWWYSSQNTGENGPSTVKRVAVVKDELTKSQMETVRQSDTLFLATGYRGEGEDVRYGNDASHRGGAPGWIDVRNNKTIFLPDYAGNNHYNTFGNLVMDNRMGVTIPQFETGGMLQLTGIAKLHLEQDAAAQMYLGALHVVEFNVEGVVELPAGSLPVLWTQESLAQSERFLQVTRKVKESDDVTSFHLKPLYGEDPKLWKYKPGQHLPIRLTRGNDDVLLRTYSLSSGNEWGVYRISVKREPFGQASQFLHGKVHVGDRIQVSQPAGDFVLNQDSKKTLVLISTGVGVTPILSMLHSFVQTYPKTNRKAVWIHGARNGKHHPFQQELSELADIAGDSLKTHVVYSRPLDDDKGYNSQGHIDAELIQTLVPDLKNAEYYMCGTAAFMADVDDGLQKLGVPSKSIEYESF